MANFPINLTGQQWRFACYCPVGYCQRVFLAWHRTSRMRAPGPGNRGTEGKQKNQQARLATAHTVWNQHGQPITLLYTLCVRIHETVPCH